MKFNLKYIIKKAFLFLIYMNLLLLIKNIWSLGLDKAILYYGENINTILLQSFVGFIFGGLIGLRNLYKQNKSEKH